MNRPRRVALRSTHGGLKQEFTRNRSESCADEKVCESVACVVLFFRGSWDAQASMVVESQDSNGEIEALWTGSSTLPQLHHSGLLSMILSGSLHRGRPGCWPSRSLGR